MQSASQPAEEQESAIDAIIALMRQANKLAYEKIRVQSGVELFERALALADASQPGDSLVTAEILGALARTRIMFLHGDASDSGEPAAREAAWREDPHAVATSRRSLQLLLARYEAGTISRPTPDEAAYYERTYELNQPEHATDGKWTGGGTILTSVANLVAVNGWASAEILSRDPALLDLLARGMVATLRLAMRRCAVRVRASSGMLQAVEARFDFNLHENMRLRDLFMVSLDSFYLPVLRTHGLTSAEELKLSRMLAAFESMRDQTDKVLLDEKTVRDEKAAADLARHGLRRCTLPDCGATEPHPKAFKLCGRCKSTAYCCPEHAAQDWRRHKRAECSRPAAAE